MIIIITTFLKHSCLMYFQMELHYNQTFSKILTQQKFSIYYRPSAPIYLVSLYSRDFVVLVLQGQVNSITVNVSLVSMTISGLARCNRSFCCGPVVVRLCCLDLKCCGVLEIFNVSIQTKIVTSFFQQVVTKSLNYRVASPFISIECL